MLNKNTLILCGNNICPVCHHLCPSVERSSLNHSDLVFCCHCGWVNIKQTFTICLLTTRSLWSHWRSTERPVRHLLHTRSTQPSLIIKLLRDSHMDPNLPLYHAPQPSFAVFLIQLLSIFKRPLKPLLSIVFTVTDLLWKSGAGTLRQGSKYSFMEELI